MPLPFFFWEVGGNHTTWRKTQAEGGKHAEKLHTNRNPNSASNSRPWSCVAAALSAMPARRFTRLLLLSEDVVFLPLWWIGDWITDGFKDHRFVLIINHEIDPGCCYFHVFCSLSIVLVLFCVNIHWATVSPCIRFWYWAGCTMMILFKIYSIQKVDLWAMNTSLRS